LSYSAAQIEALDYADLVAGMVRMVNQAQRQKGRRH